MTIDGVELPALNEHKVALNDLESAKAKGLNRERFAELNGD